MLQAIDNAAGNVEQSKPMWIFVCLVALVWVFCLFCFLWGLFVC